MSQPVDRNRVLRLVEQILTTISAGGSDEQLNALFDELEPLVPHPHVTDLIFYPDLCGFEADRVLTANEITDAALNYTSS